MPAPPLPDTPQTAPAPNGEVVGRFLAALWRFSRSLKQDLDPLLASRYDLDSPRFFILQGIRGGHCYPKVLAEHLHLPPTLLSRYLDQLRKQGLIERHIDAQDSRRTRLSVTPQGELLALEVTRTTLKLAAERLSAADPTQIGELTDLLEQLDAHRPAPL